MPLVVTFGPDQPSAKPGGEATTTVEVANLGQLVEEVDLEVLGPVGAYATVEPATLRLYPGAAGTAVIRFGPPAGHEPGPHPFGIRASSTVTPGDVCIEEAVLDVGALTAFSAEIRPRQSRARRKARHRITVFNEGNGPATVHIAAQDTDDELQLTHATTITVPAGGAATARLTARVLAGRRGDIHPFTVQVSADDAPPVVLQAMVRTERRSMLPIVAAVAVVGALLVVIALNRNQTVKSRATLTSGGADTKQGASLPGPGDSTQKSDPAGATTTVTKKPGATTTSRGATTSTALAITTTAQPPLTPPPIPHPTTGQAQVPDVYGKKTADAVAALKARGFVVDYAVAYTPSRTFVLQTIWGQYPAPNTMLDKGSHVAVMQWDKAYCDAHPDEYDQPANWCYEATPPPERVEPSATGR